MTTGNSKTAVICTNQANILDVFRQVLKKMEFDEIMANSIPAETIRRLAENDDAVLILDWGIGETDAINILRGVQASHRSGVRPIFLFSRAEVDALEGVALEFGVMQIHMGEMSRDLIEARVETLLNTQVYSGDLRDSLNALMENRKRKDNRGAQMILKALYEKHSKDPFVVGEYAEDLLQNDEVDRAQNVVKPLVDEKKHPRLLNILGRCLMRKGNFEEATVYLQQADLINPYNIKRLLRLGDAYMQIDNTTRAKATFDRALKLDPDNKEAKSGMGQSLLLAGDVNEALVFLRQLSGDAEMASVFNMAAILSIRNGRFNDGMELYRTACKTVGAGNKAILGKLGFNMGLACYRNSMLERAFYYFSAATKLDDSNEKAKAGKAFLQKQVGSGSKETFEMDPDLLTALLRDIWADDDLSGQDMSLRGKPTDYDMEF